MLFHSESADQFYFIPALHIIFQYLFLFHTIVHYDHFLFHNTTFHHMAFVYEDKQARASYVIGCRMKYKWPARHSVIVEVYYGKMNFVVCCKTY